MIILTIDSTDSKEIKVGLRKNRLSWFLRRKTKKKKGSQVLLPLIRELLKRHSLTFSNLERVEVNTGPGSFTGVRLGVTVANTLCFALKIKVNGKKLGEFVQPLYQ